MVRQEGPIVNRRKSASQAELPRCGWRQNGARPARWFMKRNLATPHGQARSRFRMAHNDSAGAWSLRVTDVTSGEAASKALSLE